MPVYSYFLFGAEKNPPLQFDLDSDASAIALSICVLRDDPNLAQVWIIEDRDPVAVRVRRPDSDIGELVDLRPPMPPAANAAPPSLGPSAACA